jgi:phosphoadenosine phosphosulfate reductase
MQDEHQLNDYVEAYAGLEGRGLLETVTKDFKGRAALLSSFGAESAVLLHMTSEVAPDLPVIFLDSEKLFPETIQYRDQLTRELGLRNVQTIAPDGGDLKMHDADGDLHKINTDQCCHVRKTLPMEAAFRGFDVMISGRKRFHGATRAALDYVTIQDGRLKVDPLAGFTGLDLQSYMQSHHLPSHPLRLQGYLSVGCQPCTTHGGTENNPRAGRWANSEKTECGIHFSANGKIIRTDVRSGVAA